MALCNAGDTSGLCVAAARRCLTGERVDAPTIAEAAALVQRSIEPGGSVHASSEYRRHIAGVLDRARARAPRTNGRAREH